MSQTPLPPGTSLKNEKYRIEYLLGAGGFGYVYRAVDQNWRCYAIKEAFDKNWVVRAENGRDVIPNITKTGCQKIHEHQRIRAREEAERFQQPHLKHPNLVPILGCFDQFGTTFLIMPLIVGETLKDALQSNVARETWWQLAVLGQIADALDVLHRSNLIHRDLKPENVLVSQFDGKPVPVLLDMGAAREYDCAENLHTGIATDFGAPEIVSDFEARTYGKPGPETDCFALAGIAFLMLSGVNPVGYVTRVTMRKRNNIDPLGCPLELSQVVWLVLKRSLTLKTASRHCSAPGLFKELAKAMQSSAEETKKHAAIDDLELSEKLDIDDTPPQTLYQNPSSMLDALAAGIAMLAVCVVLILMAGPEKGILYSLVFLLVHLIIAVFAVKRYIPAALAIMPFVNLWVCFNAPISSSKKV